MSAETENPKTIEAQTQLDKAFFMAAIRKDFQAIERLSEQKANPNALDDGCSPLGWVIYMKQHDDALLVLVRALLKVKADPNRSSIWREPLTSSALTLSVEFDLCEIVETLLMAKADPNVSLSERYAGDSILHLAVARHSEETTKILLEAKADVWKRGKNGRRPLEASRSTRISRLLKEVMQKDDAMPLAEKETALLEATAKGDLKQIKWLIDRMPIDRTSISIDPLDPLVVAVKYNHIKALEILINEGFKPKLTSTNQTLLHIAAMYGRVEIMAMILRNITQESELDIRDESGFTACDYARKNQDTTIVELIKSRQKKLNIALRNQVKDQNIEKVKELLSARADVSMVEDKYFKRVVDIWGDILGTTNAKRETIRQLLLDAKRQASQRAVLAGLHPRTGENSSIPKDSPLFDRQVLRVAFQFSGNPVPPKKENKPDAAAEQPQEAPSLFLK